MIRDVLGTGDFTGKAGETLVLYTRGAIPAPRVLIVGLGDAGKFDLQGVRNASATAARKARELGVKHFATIVHGAGIGGLEPERASQAVAEGALLGLYRYEGYRSKPPKDWKPDPEKMTVVEFSGERQQALEAGIRRGESIAAGRQPGATPGQYTGQPHDADASWPKPRRRSRTRLGSTFEALGRAAVQGARHGDLHGRGRGIRAGPEADHPRTQQGPGRPAHRRARRQGRHLRFGRHLDQAGRRDVEDEGRHGRRSRGDRVRLGVAARLKLPLHVVGLAPCAENLPGGRAQKPGDVFTGMTGKTMEVISTDAEGRMLLADALAYAARFKPAAVVDIATLTGVQSMALGPQAAGFFANDEALAGPPGRGSRGFGERLWRFPLYDEYLETIKSQVADVKNTGGRYGGLGTSAKFIEHFTEGYPWAHVDMASMALSDDDKPAQPKGATGYGVRLFTALLEGWVR